MCCGSCTLELAEDVENLLQCGCCAFTCNASMSPARKSVKMMTRDEHEQIAPLLVKHGTKVAISLLLGMLLNVSSQTALLLGMLF